MATSAWASAPLAQIGAVLLGLVVLGRLAGRLEIPPLTLPLLAGLALGGIEPLARHFGPPAPVLEVGTPVAVVLLLFTLGLDHGDRDRVTAVAGGCGLGLLDGALNAVPGALAGWLIGPGLQGAALLGGVTWASSWAAATGLLSRRGWMGNRETPPVLATLVLEHLGLTVYLPLTAALLTPGGAARVAASVLTAAVAVIGAAWLIGGPRRARALRRLVLPAGAGDHPETMLLVLAGVALTVAGLAESLRVPAAGAAFLAGAVLAGPEAGRARPAIDALRELSAAATFLLVGASVGAGGALPGAVLGAVALGLIASATKFLTGWSGAGRLGVAAAGRCRAGVALVARGEMSVALAGLAVSAGLDRLAATAAVCVLVTDAAAAAGLRLPPACRPRGSRGSGQPARLTRGTRHARRTPRTPRAPA
jgi:CPA2 family monovalent cation:H+ antiporter-2